MQEIQSIDGGVGRLFGRVGGGEGGGGGERRWKPHQYHQGFVAGGHGYQALKCPRCDSLNTKFCYYNNYNLSQPRYFCKGCRRYWTKGGVLRNVPVGGGCRKNKRSKQKPAGSNGDPSSSVDVAPTAQRKSSDSLNSSSDSNTSPAKAKATTPTPFTLSEAQPTKLINFQESSTQNQSFPPVFDNCAADNHRMFSEIDTFKNLLTSSSDQLPLGFKFNQAPEVSSFIEQQYEDQQVVQKQEPKWKQWMDETYARTSNGGVATEEWEGGGGGAEDGLFDESYWSQNPWSKHDHQLSYFH